jgi:hypothetical protein
MSRVTLAGPRTAPAQTVLTAGQVPLKRVRALCEAVLAPHLLLPPVIRNENAPYKGRLGSAANERFSWATS